MKNNSHQRGFMQIVFLAVVIIAGLAYFNVDLQGLAQSPLGEKVLTIMRGAMTDYILPLIKYLRENVVNLVLSSSETASSTAPAVISQ